ncbi:zf-DNL-domain-containing protein [Lindgomyces ingoldianus]|uniref:Zf-DNL-domain-containing protein n=1 Tax=Lindgomyces ingoldianus TaxID=673940 RepID=A0ACB6REX0_9PLEO|nr:zf-DNL-domain-containing protein [Lindgomyces ingoldianus]KAF2477686.1 zf-DNL-domain-containing protein [Lindgomyces ingoldianus]
MRPSPPALRCLLRASTPRPLRAPPTGLILFSKRHLHTPLRTSLPLRSQALVFRNRPLLASVRHESTASNSTPQSGDSTAPPPSRLDRDQVPAYEMTFTCKKCSTRSSHRVSKQGYHHGTVLITCPGCKSRHLMSDHLKIFSDKPVTVEDLMREKGQLVKRGSLSTEGDVEFWDDGSSTPRSANFVPNSTTKTDPGAEECRLTESPASHKSTRD